MEFPSGYIAVLGCALSGGSALVKNTTAAVIRCPRVSVLRIFLCVQAHNIGAMIVRQKPF